MCKGIKQSSKFEKVSLNETSEFPFWGLNIRVNFYLRDSENKENMKKIKKIYFIIKY